LLGKAEKTEEETKAQEKEAEKSLLEMSEP